MVLRTTFVSIAFAKNQSTDTSAKERLLYNLLVHAPFLDSFEEFMPQSGLVYNAKVTRTRRRVPLVRFNSIMEMEHWFFE